MGNVTILLGLGIVLFVLVYMMFKLGDTDKTHFPLQLIILGCILGLMLLSAKIAHDDANFCSWQVANTTISGTTTSYDWSYECSTNPNDSAKTLVEITAWFMRIVGIYIFIYFIVYLFQRGKEATEAKYK